MLPVCPLCYPPKIRWYGNGEDENSDINIYSYLHYTRPIRITRTLCRKQKRSRKKFQFFLCTLQLRKKEGYIVKIENVSYKKTMCIPIPKYITSIFIPQKTKKHKNWISGTPNNLKYGPCVRKDKICNSILILIKNKNRVATTSPNPDHIAINSWYKQSPPIQVCIPYHPHQSF